MLILTRTERGSTTRTLEMRDQCTDYPSNGAYMMFVVMLTDTNLTETLAPLRCTTEVLKQSRRDSSKSYDATGTQRVNMTMVPWGCTVAIVMEFRLVSHKPGYSDRPRFKILPWSH